jgi:hypothetical protein
MTPNEIAVQLAEPSGRQFDVPFRRMIKDKVIYWTERMVRNTIDKDPKRRAQLLQPLLVPMHSIGNEATGHPGNYKKYSESLECIPRPMFANSINFDFVGSQDGATAFIYSPGLMQDRFGSSDKYLGTAPRYSYLGGKIQVYRNPELPAVLMNYIPANMKEYAEFQLACGQTLCQWDDCELNLPGDILQLVIQSIMQIELRLPPDKAREEVVIDPQK